MSDYSTSELDLNTNDNKNGNLYIENNDFNPFGVSNLLDITKSDKVNDKYKSSNNISSHQRSNLNNVIDSSFSSKSSYETGTDEAYMYGCITTESSIPATSEASPMCFKPCEDGYKPKNYSTCQNGTWKYTDNILTRTNKVKSTTVILVVDNKEDLPGFVFIKLTKDGAVRVEIYVKRDKCINVDYWKTVSLETKRNKDESSNFLLYLFIFFLIILLIGCLYYAYNKLNR